MGGQFNLLVTPLGGPVLTGDQSHAMDPAQVAADERVPGLRVFRGAVREPQVSIGVLVPRVRLEELVLGGG